MPEQVLLTKGTKEHLIVDVTDRLGNIADLEGSSARYDVRLKGDGENWVAQGTATTIGMSAYCLVDTATWVKGVYELFLQFDYPPESPRLGPFQFELNL